MIGNNMIFFVIWWVFFRAFRSVGGWQFDDMVALMVIAAGSYGLSKICCGGVKEISRAIATGNLDPFMTQPKNLLLHLVGAKSYSKGWGQLMTAIILIFLGGKTTLNNIPLLFIFIVNGSLIFAATAVIAHSLAFWLGSIESVSKKYCDSLFVFVNYPVNIYSGPLQIIMFTIFPAGIIGYIPVSLLKNFSWANVILLLGSSSLFVSLAFFIFYRGLKKYESGNHFGMHL
jgi:ABC-2 type transport system permease protein